MTSPSNERHIVALDDDMAAIVDRLPKEITPMRKVEEPPPPPPKKVYHLKRSDYKAVTQKPKPRKSYEQMTANDLERMEAAEAKRLRKGKK